MADDGECRHAGRELTGPEREAGRHGHGRPWRFCLNPDKPLGDVVCPCKGCGPACPGYAARPPEGAGGPHPGWTRHLVYHVLPVRGNGTWQRNLDQLKPRLKLFDGRKVVAVATGNPTGRRVATRGGAAGEVGHSAGVFLDPPEAVADYLGCPDAEILPVPNDPGLREVATWAPLWERLREFAAPGHCAFYGHAKAVTRPFDPGTSVHLWTSLLYAANLDHWPLVADALGRHPLAGALKKVGHGFTGSGSRFHFSGSFFWCRLADFFARDWKTLDRVWWGTESWPGCRFAPDEAAGLFHTSTVPHLDMYRLDYATRVYEEYREWRRKQPVTA